MRPVILLCLFLVLCEAVDRHAWREENFPRRHGRPGRYDDPHHHVAAPRRRFRGGSDERNDGSRSDRTPFRRRMNRGRSNPALDQDAPMGREMHARGPRRDAVSAGFIDLISPYRNIRRRIQERYSKIKDRFTEVLEPLKDLNWSGDLTLGPLSVGLDIEWLGINVKPWYTGENVCEERLETEEESPGEIQRHQVTTSTVCDETATMYKCTATMNVYGKTKTVSKIYKCCHGYDRIPGEIGCGKKLELTDLLSTADKLGLTAFLEALESVQLKDTLSSGNFTVFAPTNSSLERDPPTDKIEMSNVVMVSSVSTEVARGMRNLLASHVVPGFLQSSDMEDEEVIESVPPYKIRINYYKTPNRLMTANCVPVSSADHLATNGVIHVVDGVLPAVTDSIIGIISKNPDLSQLKTMIGKTGMVDLLKGNGQFTLFAPTNEAFDAMDMDVKDFLLQTTTCLKNSIMGHMIENVICSAIIKGQGRTYNMLGDLLPINRTEDDKIFIGDGAQVIGKDIMATNGVIHLIDRVIVSQKALDIMSMAATGDAGEILDLIQKTGLDKELRSLDNFTIFLPTDEAMDALSEDIKEQMSSDRVFLSKVLRYHVVPHEKLDQHDFVNDRELTTLNGPKRITVKEYSSFPLSMATRKTIQCAEIIPMNMEGCNAVGHFVNKVLLPPVGDVLDVLYQHSQLSELTQLFKEADLSEKLQLSGPFTLFAPSNKAFEEVDPELLKELRSDKRKLIGFLAHHLTHDVLCCAGMSLSPGMQWWWKPKEMTLDPGSHVVLERRDQDDRLLVDGTPITSCDLTATNGVVHILDSFLPSASVKYGLHLHHSLIQNHNNKEIYNWMKSVVDRGFDWFPNLKNK